MKLLKENAHTRVSNNDTNPNMITQLPIYALAKMILCKQKMIK